MTPAGPSKPVVILFVAAHGTPSSLRTEQAALLVAVIHQMGGAALLKRFVGH